MQCRKEHNCCCCCCCSMQIYSPCPAGDDPYCCYVAAAACAHTLCQSRAFLSCICSAELPIHLEFGEFKYQSISGQRCCAVDTNAPPAQSCAELACFDLTWGADLCCWQVLLFTATMPEALQETAAKWQRKPVRIHVATGDMSISETITQVHLVICILLMVSKMVFKDNKRQLSCASDTEALVTRLPVTSSHRYTIACRSHCL